MNLLLLLCVVPFALGKPSLEGHEVERRASDDGINMDSLTMKQLHKNLPMLDEPISIVKRETDEYCYEDRCIYVYHRKKQWKDAKSSCEHDGMRLVQIEDRDYNDYVKGVIEGHVGSGWRHKYDWKDDQVAFWIGLRQKNRHDYYWTDGSKAHYFNWYDHEQSDMDHKGYDNQHCIRIVAHDGKWGDHRCSKYYKYICEKVKHH